MKGRIERWIARPLFHVLTWGSRQNGRLVLFAIVAVYLSGVAVSRVVWRFDAWPVLGVPSGPTLFFDARNLTAAWECQRLGYDPLYRNPCDPWRRPLMYLRPWLLLEPLGLGQADTFALSIALIGAMFVSFALLTGRVPAGSGVVLAIAMCSPAVMLAVERGNMDVALFSLIAIASLLWRAVPGAARILSPSIVLLAATAKIYPVFALAAFVVSGSQLAARAASLCLAAFAGYAVYAIRDIAHAVAIAPQGDHFSYGVRILPAHLYHQVGADHWSGPTVIKQLIAALPLCALAGVIVVRIHRRLAAPDDEVRVASNSLIAMHAGAFIYLGTFATANNFDYRLVFLLLTLPQLMQWARTPTHRLSSLAAVTIVGILTLLWVSSLSRWLHLWDELASWVVTGLLVAVVAATVPSLAVLRHLVGGRFTSARSAA